MSFVKSFLSFIPEIKGPSQKNLPFGTKVKWTLGIIVLYFVLGMIPLLGLGENSMSMFEYWSVILGASMGSLLSLGIGPIVTSSIILQLLKGVGIINIDTSTHEGRAYYQGVQKILVLTFIIFQSIVYVMMGGFAPDPALQGTSAYVVMQFSLIAQLFIGGLIVMYMDDLISKWGIGSGISLFIVAGVSRSMFVRAFSFVPSPTNPDMPTGAIPALVSAVTTGDTITALLQMATLASTIIIFMIVVFTQAMKVEIPLTFGRVRGYGVRWPLKFIYTSNMPVILIGAFIAMMQLVATLFANAGMPILGSFSGQTPVSGFVYWISPPNLVNKLFTQSMTLADIGRAFSYTLFMMGGAVMFSLFWVETSGLDAKSQAKQILKTGLQIPGFRRDPRIIEHLLRRYIKPLTVMGALTVGALAALADMGSALTSGTGLLLSVMIIYQLYEQIARDHMSDMHPMMKRFMKK